MTFESVDLETNFSVRTYIVRTSRSRSGFFSQRFLVKFGGSSRTRFLRGLMGAKPDYFSIEPSKILMLTYICTEHICTEHILNHRTVTILGQNTDI